MRKTISIEHIISTLLVANGLLFTIEDSLQLPVHIKPLILFPSLLLCLYSIYFTNNLTQIKTFIGLSFLGSEPLLFLMPILFLPKFIVRRKGNDGSRVGKLQFAVILFLTYCAAIFLLTYIPDFSIFNILLWLIIFASILVFFNYYSAFSYTEDDAGDIFGFFYRMIRLQVIIVLLQLIIHRDFNPGDSWTGSSGNSVVVGFYLTLLLIVLLIQYFIKLKRNLSWVQVLTVRNILILIGISALLYFNDSKMIILSFVIAIIAYFLCLLIIRFLTSLNPYLFLKTILISVVLIIAFTTVLVIANIYGKFTYSSTGGIGKVIGEYFDPVLKENGTNAKFVLYKRVYSDALKDDFFAWLFGVGPGKFGSKASNIMAYDVLYKDESQLKLPSSIPPYSSAMTKKYMSDLWTQEIALTSRFRSATLSFPFAGLVTIKAELGLIGLLLYLSLIYSFSYFLIRKAYVIDDWKLKNWAIALSITWFSLPLHMVFDNFQEKNYIMLPLFLASAVICSIKN